MTTRFFSFDRRNRLFMTAFLFVIVAAQVALAGGGGGGGLPWETPLSRVATSLTGPVALAISLIALMVAGGTLVFGGELRADATIDSHWSNRIVPGGQGRMAFDAEAADMLWIG